MLDLFMAMLALFVCLLIVPAFLLATGFAAAIPFLGLGVISQLWSKGREITAQEGGERTEQLESLDDWRKRQASAEEEVWRHTG